MKKIAALLLLLFFSGSACAEYWDGTRLRAAECCEDRPGCQVLQTVMMGSFAQFDAQDGLNVRVLSAALPRLSAVTQEDFTHFAQNFGVEEETLRELYYIALANCLRSDMLVTPLADDMEQQNARTVLALFLDPDGENDEAQMAVIRENCNAETTAMLAEYAQVPAGFVEYLIGTDAQSK